MPLDMPVSPSFSVLGRLALSALQQQRRLVLLSSVAAALASITAAFLIPAWYLSSASFLPDNPGSSLRSGALLGIASQLGIQTSFAESPQFYAYLVKSRTVLERVATLRYPDRQGRTRELATYYRFDNLDSARRLESTIRKLDADIRSDLDIRTGVTSFYVRARDPALSTAIADSLLAQLNNFLSHVRASRASNERVFLEGRVDNAQRELLAREQVLRQFYERNRQMGNSPGLQFEELNLRRHVELAVTLYTQLQSDLERAELNEVRDTPTLTVVERPVEPVRKAGPPRTLISLAGTLAGLLLALTLSMAKTARAHSADT